MHSVKYILIYILLYLCNSLATNHDFNPYDVLGLARTASDKEIRTAYKKLARHWHPDKNSEPNAHDQFTKINAAYEVTHKTNSKQIILGLFSPLDSF
jgi:DnaJ-class molecular chaperone